MYFPALGLLCVMSCNGNSSHRNNLTFRTLCRNVTSDEFLRKKIKPKLFTVYFPKFGLL